jgi:hypothetical protein
LAAPFDFDRELLAQRRDASVGEALGRVVDAGQALVAGRIALGAAEARVAARSVFALSIASVAALIGWLYVVAGTVDVLAREYPRFAVELGMGGLHIACALALIALARSRAPTRSELP